MAKLASWLSSLHFCFHTKRMGCPNCIFLQLKLFLSGYLTTYGSSFFGDQHRFGLDHTIFGDRCLEKWRSPNNAGAIAPRNLINWFPVPADKKASLGTTDIQPYLFKFFSAESGRYQIEVCKCGPQY